MMPEIDQNMYQSSPFYRGLVNQLAANERERCRLEQELKAEQQARQAAEAAYKRQLVVGYVNQIPYQELVPAQPMQWRAPYSLCQNNFVNYWSQNSSANQPTEQQLAELRSAFHHAVDCSAQAAKAAGAPIPALVFDGIGIMTAGNLLELINSVVSLADTARKL